MDKSVPPGAALLLAFIYRTETKTEPPACYDVIYGHNQDKLQKPLTTMTLAQVLRAQSSWTKRFGSSAAGAGQFMRATLTGLMKEMELPGTLLFKDDLQDRLGFKLLKRRGYEEFMAGTISRTEFGKRLAQEWASFPVLAATQGAKRKVKRGQSYYAGDGVNKSLTDAATVEAVLDKVKAMAGKEPVPVKPEPKLSTPAGRTDALTVRVVQQKLRELGYTEVGPDDGSIGKLTRTAILAFRSENGLPVSDVIDGDLLAALSTAKPRNLPRKDTAPAEVIEKVPEVAANWRTELATRYGIGGTLLVMILDFFAKQFRAGAENIQPWLDMAARVPLYVWALIVLLPLLALYANARWGKHAGIEAFQTGARR